MKLIVVPWLPSVYRNRVTWAITIAPYVFVIREQKDNAAILAHEEIHLQQAKELGWCKFYWRYITDLNFRSSVEAAGYAKQREVEGGIT